MQELRIEEFDVDERRKKILEKLGQEGKVKVAELSKLFGISEVTIRNDLSELENSGMLERIHGGAVSSYRAYYNMSLMDRLKANVEEKRKIAAEAASLISDGDTVMISSGSTTLFTVQELRNKKNLTIVTNSISNAQEAGSYPNIHVILLGGSYNHQYQFTYGDDTLAQLRKYKADKLILASDGISFAEGITTYHHFEAEVSRQMMSRVKNTIVVADYTKIGRASFAYIESIQNADMLISNKKANHEETTEISKNGVAVKLV